MTKKKATKKKATKKKAQPILTNIQMLEIERSLAAMQSNANMVESIQRQVEIIRLKANSQIQELSLKINVFAETTKNLKKKHENLKERIKKDLDLEDLQLLRYDPQTGELDV